MSKSKKHYDGKVCTSCRGTLRYISTKHCVNCQRRQSKTYNKKHSDARREYAKDYYNSEEGRAKIKQWKQENAESLLFDARERQIKKLKATPPWYDAKKVKQIYLLRNWLNETFNMDMECDHIIPFFGKDVCGLHTHENIQILNRAENQRKSNQYPFETKTHIRYAIETLLEIRKVCLKNK